MYSALSRKDAPYGVRTADERTEQVNHRMRSSIAALTLVFALAAPACGGSTYNLVGTQQFISMDAEIEISRGGGSYDTNLTLKFLPPPQRVRDELRFYVVWFSPEGGTPYRVATLDYDEGDREGTAHATFPDSTFNILVTAESSTNPATPSEHHVLEQRVRAE